ncbi:tyrosine-type recombinase/integrase [Halogeometricum luteum]|uniref:Tyr recombinase domain-containing protein n=1 Tax=Halogeometricum luteum TaxID=2950537 RepID=A0ABU2G5L8_9EURY|nr:tyrosine-type recombinase/integrase [Halogeometricum sp. S3BR5-2]MDS0295776.1 hypothetical protein [Halogeometricum sp. S3BR5-2]
MSTIGFRPCDIEDSRVQWFDTENENDAHLSLPREEDSKAGKRNRSGKISPEAARVFNYWLEERKEDPAYEGTDAVWLNQKNKPYSARSLRYQLMSLQRAAGMNVEERENGWYMIRRGVGTDIINKEGDIITLMHQLRIDRYETAMRYVMTADQAADRYFSRR